MRLLAGYEERRDAFSEQGVGIIAAVADSEKHTLSVAESLGYPVAYGVTKQQGFLLGSWWNEEMNFIQPSEFVLSDVGEVIYSAYSNAPIGRMDPSEALTLITARNKRKK